MTRSQMVEVAELFDVGSGHQLSTGKLLPLSAGEGIAYVSRTHRNNGVDNWSAPIDGLVPAPAGAISVCLRSRNHALASFVQSRPFYTSYHVAVLTPRAEMTLSEKLWWCECIQANRFRFNFGRQANRTLSSLQLPRAVPDFVQRAKSVEFQLSSPESLVLDVSSWKPLKLVDLFSIKLGKHDTRRSLEPGRVPYVSGSDVNNGVSAHVNVEADFPAGSISVANNGSVGAAHYQPDDFTASIDATVLLPKFDLTPAAALAICVIIRHEAARFNYARKLTLDRINELSVCLPVTTSGEPDVEALELIIGSSRFSSLI